MLQYSIRVSLSQDPELNGHNQPVVEQHISFGSDKLYIVNANKCFNCIKRICCGIGIRPSQDHWILRVQMVQINLARARPLRLVTPLSARGNLMRLIEFSLNRTGFQ